MRFLAFIAAIVFIVVMLLIAWQIGKALTQRQSGPRKWEIDYRSTGEGLEVRLIKRGQKPIHIGSTDETPMAELQAEASVQAKDYNNEWPPRRSLFP